MISQVKEGYVKSEIHNTVTTIEFFHPQSNSLPGKLLEILAKEIHSAGNDQDTNVIILSSAGEATFCAGASFEELAAIKTETEGKDFFSGFAHVINEIKNAPSSLLQEFRANVLEEE